MKADNLLLGDNVLLAVGSCQTDDENGKHKTNIQFLFVLFTCRNFEKKTTPLLVFIDVYNLNDGSFNDRYDWSITRLGHNRGECDTIETDMGHDMMRDLFCICEKTKFGKIGRNIRKVSI